jgi:hypothetical protein
MESTDLRHHLLAILAADAVGYSRLMSIDDRGTVEQSSLRVVCFGSRP